MDSLAPSFTEKAYPNVNVRVGILPHDITLIETGYKIKRTSYYLRPTLVHTYLGDIKNRMKCPRGVISARGSLKYTHNTYSRVRNKHTPTLINFLTFFQGLRPYSGLHRAYLSSISIRYRWGYAYSFSQILQGLRLFQTLE